MEEVILGILVVAWFVTVLGEDSMATEMVQNDWILGQSLSLNLVVLINHYHFLVVESRIISS